MTKIRPQNEQLYTDVCQLIETTRQRIAISVNSEAIMMNWQIGWRIKEDILQNQRAEYGKEIVKNLAFRLTEKYGNGWSHKKLLHCLRAAETFSEDEIVSALRRQLTWTHYTQLPDKKLLKEKLHKAIQLARELYLERKG